MQMHALSPNTNILKIRISIKKQVSKYFLQLSCMIFTLVQQMRYKSDRKLEQHLLFYDI